MHEDAGAPGDDQSQHITQIVACVGQKRHGIADETISGLQNHKAGVQRDSDGKGFAKTCGGVRVASMRMACVRMASVVMAIVVMAIVIMPRVIMRMLIMTMLVFIAATLAH